MEAKKKSIISQFFKQKSDCGCGVKIVEENKEETAKGKIEKKK